MCTYRSSFNESSHFSPSFLLGFVVTRENFFSFFNIMSLSCHASLHFSSHVLNKVFPVRHRYLHCINPFCASGGCSGLPAFGSV